MLKMNIGSCSRNLACKILRRSQSTHLRNYYINVLPILLSLKINICLITLIPVNFEEIWTIIHIHNQLIFVYLFNTYMLFIIRNWLMQLS